MIEELQAGRTHRERHRMTSQTYQVADLFCGAGGSSTGAEKAIEEIGGRMELVAVNHWPIAVQTHQLNHPTAQHYLQDLDNADPEAIVPEGRLDLLMASPECRFHSRARGGKPIHDQGRMNPWVVQRWLTSLNIRCLLVENVPEFTEWGPLLDDGRPDKTKKGMYFEEWVKSLWGLGYEAEWRMLNAANYGDATTRVRFFLQARNDGQPIRWPEATHSKTGGPSLLHDLPKWRAARDIIDWSNQGRSLLDDPKYRKKPLSEKTRRRIAKGLERFGGPLAHLYIRLLELPQDSSAATHDTTPIAQESFILNHNGENGSTKAHSIDDPAPAQGAGYLVEPEDRSFHGSDRQHTAPRSHDQPLHTITTLTGGGLYLAEAKAQPFVGANRNQNVPKGIGEPIPTATTAHGGGSFLVEPDMKAFVLGQQSGGAPRPASDPIPTVTTDGAISLIQASIIEYYGQSHAREVTKPLSTILSIRKHGVMKPTLVKYYTHSHCADVDTPLPALTTKARFGLADPVLVELNHGNSDEGPNGNDHRSHSVDLPLGSLTTSRGLGLAQPVLVQTSQTGGNGSYARPTEQPVPTLTTRNDMGVATPTVKPYLVPNFGERDGQEPRTHDVDDPTPTVTSRGAGSLVSPTLVEPILKQMEKANLDLRRLVFVDGQAYLLDIRFRMLQNSELARAMGFEDEETSYEFVGNVGEITKQIGNAVPVHLAAALVKAVLDPGAENQESQQEETRVQRGKAREGRADTARWGRPGSKSALRSG